MVHIKLYPEETVAEEIPETDALELDMRAALGGLLRKHCKTNVIGNYVSKDVINVMQQTANMAEGHVKRAKVQNVK